MSSTRRFIIKDQPEIEVSVGVGGYVVIKQDDFGGGEIIQIRPELVPELIERLQQVAEVCRDAIRGEAVP